MGSKTGMDCNGDQVRGSRSTGATSGILAAIAGAAAIGLLPWLGKPIFPDEAASLYSAHLGWTALLQHSRVVDLVLLPYYSFLHLWIQISDSIEWVRFLSLLAFGLTVFLVGHLGVRLGGRSCGCSPRSWRVPIPSSSRLR